MSDGLITARSPARSAAERAAPERHSRGALLCWLLLAIPVVVMAERAWALRWVADDGFIHLRVVDQLLAGNGPVFNAGERVEASTSPLWVFLLALADILTPVRLEWIAVLLGIGLTTTAVALALTSATVLLPRRTGDEIRLPLGMAVYVAVPQTWTYASSGLEGGLVLAWLGACLLVLARWSRSATRLGLPGALLIGVGTLIRPELGLFTVAFVVAVLFAGWRHDRWPDRLGLLACVFALPLAYQIFRMGYYGVVVPNTAVAKEAGLTDWSRGWHYLRNFTDPYALWVPLGALALGAYLPLLRHLGGRDDRRGLAVALAFVGAAVVGSLYTVKMGGDWIQGRLLLPYLFALVAPVAVVPLRRQYLPALLVLPWALVCGLFLRTPVDESIGARTNPVTLSDYGWTPSHPERVAAADGGFVYHGVPLPAEPIAGQRAVHAAYGVGVSGYALGTDVFVLDVLGLGNPLAAHLELRQRSLTGHEKPLPAPWIVATGTEPGTDLDEDDFPFPLFSRRLDDPGRAPFDARVAVARLILECPRLKEFRASYTDPLTVDRFLENVVEAPSNTSLRIPAEPADAAELC